jgi:DNA-directed RNA polymerase specialized sigma24 family protein
MVDVASTYSVDYVRHTAHQVRDEHGRLTGWVMPRGGVTVEVMLDRPPFRRLAGQRATLAGRGRRRSQTLEAITDRRIMAADVWRMRVTEGMTIREIAAVVGRSPSLVGRWLVGVPPTGGGRRWV